MSTFQKIGEKIEILKGVLGKTTAELEKGRVEDYPGKEDRLLGNATISGWLDKDLMWTSDKLEKFLRYWDVNMEWWRTGEGAVLNKKGTGGDKPSDYKQNGMRVKETFYSELIEQNEEYSLIPRAVLKDYKIVPDKIIDVIIASNENEKRALERSKDMEIDGLNKKHELMVTI